MSPLSSTSWFLTGPTASGKSAVGMELARRIDAEIISLDSVAIYRGMDIGAAKPTVEQQRQVPHHLIDIVEPTEEFSLAQYFEAAKRSAAEIAAKRKQVLFVGGTPLYLKGLLRGIFEGPPADWELRHRLADEAKQHGDRWLHEQLAAVDPTSAARLHPKDTRRLIRAIEVFQKTGRPISAWQQQFDVGSPAESCRVFVLDWPKTKLYSRINRRVEAMFAAGLVEEVRRLLAGPHPNHLPTNLRSVPGEETVRLSRTARQAVGYREVIEHLEGRLGLSETISLVQCHTRQLAKRQCTWFRSLSECRFVPVAGDFDPAALAEQCWRQ